MLAEEPVLHPLSVVSVVAREVIERREAFGAVSSASRLGEWKTGHEFGDDCFDITGRQECLRACLPQREPRAFLAEEDLPAIDGVLYGVMPVEHLNRIGRELVGEEPVRRSTIGQPDDGRCVLDRLDVQRFLEQRREFRLSADERNVAR